MCCEHSFSCSRENKYAEINLQGTLDNSKYHGTERIVEIEEGVRDTESFFHETSNQEIREFV